MTLYIRRSQSDEILLTLEAEVFDGLDLSQANLRGADLAGQSLRGVNFAEAAMRGADFNGADLAGARLEAAGCLLANFYGANLRGTLFRGSVLEGAVFTGADLRAADFTDAKLFGACFKGAFFDKLTQWPIGFDPPSRGAIRGESDASFDPISSGDHADNVRGPRVNCPSCDKPIPSEARKCRHCGHWLKNPAQLIKNGLKIINSSGETLVRARVRELQGIDLSSQDLQYANLIEADLRGANLSGANLIRSGLSGANLEGANLSESNLSGSTLHEANLISANLAGISARGTSFERTLLYNANFMGANLREANFRRADVRGANFSGANLNGVNLRKLTHDASTRWPAGFDPIRQGAPPIESEFEESVAYTVPTVQCRFCDERILQGSVRCHYCGEWIVEPEIAQEESRRGLLLSGLIAGTAIILFLAGIAFWVYRN